MALSTKPWGSITQTDYADANDYCDASLIDQNKPGQSKTKTACKLQVREPQKLGGMVNRNGLFAAVAVLAGARGGVDIPMAAKKTAARMALRLYRENKLEPPASLVKLAQG